VTLSAANGRLTAALRGVAGETVNFGDLDVTTYI